MKLAAFEFEGDELLAFGGMNGRGCSGKFEAFFCDDGFLLGVGDGFYF